MDTINLDQLIGAIGRAEGWGATPDKFQIYDSNTTAPFGLLGDSKNFPELLRNPRLAYEWMVGKLTGQATPYVTLKTGVQQFQSTVIPGLVNANGGVDTTLLPQLAQKWAPIGAANDPSGLNKNWLGNVQNSLGIAPSTTQKKN